MQQKPFSVLVRVLSNSYFHTISKPYFKLVENEMLLFVFSHEYVKPSRQGFSNEDPVIICTMLGQGILDKVRMTILKENYPLKDDEIFARELLRHTFFGRVYENKRDIKLSVCW